MKKNVILVAGLALIAAAGLVVAQNSQNNTNDPMKEWIKVNMPGKNHAFLLGNMLGEWNASSKLWLQPNSEPQSSEGTCVCTPMMTGRFVQMEHSGEMMGLPFKGLGYFGYNNASEKFENVWMDSSSTSLMVSTGGKQNDNTVVWTGNYVDPMTKQTKTSKSTTRFVGQNEMVFEMYETWTDGTEFKTLEITYTRQPGSRNNVNQKAQKNIPTLKDSIENKPDANVAPMQVK